LNQPGSVPPTAGPLDRPVGRWNQHPPAKPCKKPRHGWGGIRTHERLSPLPVFKTGAFNRSATHPEVDQVGGDASLPSTNLHFAVSADRGLQELADFASKSIRPRPRPIRPDILTGYTAAPSATGRLRAEMPLLNGNASMHLIFIGSAIIVLAR
jgi:hypothetical protein